MEYLTTVTICLESLPFFYIASYLPSGPMSRVLNGTIVTPLPTSLFILWLLIGHGLFEYLQYQVADLYISLLSVSIFKENLSVTSIKPSRVLLILCSLLLFLRHKG